jgi:hypothetical protein
MSIIQQTGKLSLIIQIITGLIDALALTLPVGFQEQILRQLLTMELIVQIIEGTFYVWMLNKFNSLSNVTIYRYLDWVFTTPVMLITLCIYFIYKRNTETNIKIDENINNNENINENKGLLFYLKENIIPFIVIIIMNWLMLLFGYLGEINILSILSSTILGFIPFIIMFYIIYNKFAQVNTTTLQMFWYFVVVWGLYGVAALFNYKWKNTAYNILDLFAKNFFGLFLAYVVYTKSI